VDAVVLEPLPYHVAVREFLKREDGKIWEWIASNKSIREHADAVRFDLLKKTYRAEKESAKDCLSSGRGRTPPAGVVGQN
jgi:hypothetical protein